MKFIGFFIYFQVTSMECLFVRVDSRCHPIQPLYVGSEMQMSSIIDASKFRNDGLHLTLEQKCSSAVHCHKNCVSTYTSKCHMKRLSHTLARSNSPQRKRQCRSDLRNFDFNTQCLFCGDLCEPDTNAKASKQQYWTIGMLVVISGQMKF